MNKVDNSVKILTYNSCKIIKHDKQLREEKATGEILIKRFT